MCNLPHVAFHMSLTPTATATDPPPANSPTIHSRMVHKDQEITFFARLFKTEKNCKFPPLYIGVLRG